MQRPMAIRNRSPQTEMTGSVTQQHVSITHSHPSLESSDSDTITDRHLNASFREKGTTASEGINVHQTSTTLENEEHVRQLARQYTTQSQSQSNQGSPFEAAKDGPLDPNGSQFSARAWARAFLNLQHSNNEDELPNRVAGVAFESLSVHGYGTDTDYQKTVGNVFLKTKPIVKAVVGAKKRRIQILQDFEGVLHSGEMLCVLGPPGSGCSTFLRTVAGETHGFYVDKKSYVNYQGISPKEMHSGYRGEAIYTAEVDDHFPMMSVGDTLLFAAMARAPRTIPGGVSRDVYARHIRDVVLAMLGISHTVNTRVGNDFVRGVSGGERKRVSIAEAALSGAPLQCWDNSTRGLDSANAVEFCRTLRTEADVFESTALVAIYQAPQEAYDLFDKVILLYQGRQIFFGSTTDAKQYFEDLGFVCPERQTTADFLTSMTSPNERVIRPGFESRVPRTSEDFARAWHASTRRAQLLTELQDYKVTFTFNGEHAKKFQQSRRAEQSNMQRTRSPYTLSYIQQCKLCLWRGYRRLVGDPTIPLFQLVANFIQMLVISSVFYNLSPTAENMYRRSIVLFVGIIVNVMASILEMYTLYAQRPIVEKHARYALYHSSAEAVASMITDLPYKVINAIITNVTLYFMSNLRRDAGSFFFYLLVSFSITLTMSMLFRLIASASRSLDQALAPASIMLLALLLYTGFTIPSQYMLGWAHWIKYINPVAYAYESLLLNEFVGRGFPCSAPVPNGPGYENVPVNAMSCPYVGSVPGSSVISGTRHLLESYGYQPSHKWRNFGILIVFLVGLMLLYLVTAEFAPSARSKGEVLVFKRGYAPTVLLQKGSQDIESQDSFGPDSRQPDQTTTKSAKVQQHTSIFHWRNLCYDIKIKGEPRRILDHVDGWVKPNTLTALMGVSGAGKTTLLDVLASRVTMGIITGDIFVDGQLRNASFQRKTGYVQQQDLHLATSTVREALEFSALLRQPESVPRQEKLDYVDEVIDLLDMHEYAEAIVGQLGEGLNVEQRKRLTIGVELAAKPQLLLFLDEPTSGLDSQTSWSICNLMEKLVQNGHAILCTIHQPSAMLFQRFNRLLLLAKGGKTVYFGDIGRDSQTLIDYFVRNGADPIPHGANPAEWMLKVVGAAPGAKSEIDWPAVWRRSSEFDVVHQELDRLEHEKLVAANTESDSESSRDFSAPLLEQVLIVSKRVFQQYWRTPFYIYSKALLTVGSTIFIGFSFFKAENTQRGLQNQMFGIFILLTVFFTLVEQIIPLFVTQRTLYEARERPSKTYSWKAFLIANIAVEIPWNTLMGVLCFLCWWYPIGLFRNAEYTDSEHSRAILAVLFVWMLMLMASTFAHLMISSITQAEVAANLGNVLAMMMLIFCGILAGPSALPRFWIFMYRVNPFTYLVEGLLATGLANAPVRCADIEFLQFQAPNNTTCGSYMESYISMAGGYLQNAAATECRYCTYDNTNTFLTSVNVDFSNRWRNFGILWAFIVFNIAGAVFLYWLARVPKKTKAKKA